MGHNKRVITKLPRRTSQVEKLPSCTALTWTSVWKSCSCKLLYPLRVTFSIHMFPMQSSFPSSVCAKADGSAREGVLWVDFPLNFPSQKWRKCWAVGGRVGGGLVGGCYLCCLALGQLPSDLSVTETEEMLSCMGGGGGVPLLGVPGYLCCFESTSLWPFHHRNRGSVELYQEGRGGGGGGVASSSLGSSFLSPYCYCIKKEKQKRCNTATGARRIQTEDFFFELNALGNLSTGVHRPAVSGQRCHKCNQFYEMLYTAFQGNPRWERDCPFFSETFPFIQVKKTRTNLRAVSTSGSKWHSQYWVKTRKADAEATRIQRKKKKKKGGGGGEKGAIFQYSFHSCDSTLAGKRSRSFGQRWGGGLQPNTHAPYIICGFQWNYKLVHGGVHRMCTKKAAVSCGTSHVTTKQHCKHITSVDTQNPGE